MLVRGFQREYLGGDEALLMVAMCQKWEVKNNGDIRIVFKERTTVEPHIDFREAWDNFTVDEMTSVLYSEVPILAP